MSSSDLPSLPLTLAHPPAPASILNGGDQMTDVKRGIENPKRGVKKRCLENLDKKTECDYPVMQLHKKQSKIRSKIAQPTAPAGILNGGGDQMTGVKRVHEYPQRGVKKRRLENHDKKTECDHPVMTGGLCFVCGHRTAINISGKSSNKKNRVHLTYILNDFSLSKKELLTFRSNIYKTNLLEKKKLSLVLDLDNTLVHSVSYREFREEDLNQVRDINSILKKNIFFLKQQKMFTKVRPFAVEFLKEVSKMFELHIYTMGCRNYANTIANLLDPDETHFDFRVISRDDSTDKHTKSLDIVLGEAKAVVIVDDKLSVWPKHMNNVLRIRPYYFWELERKMKMGNHDSNGEDDELKFMLGALKKLHGLFFDEEKSCIHVMDRDVRRFMRLARMDYLNHGKPQVLGYPKRFSFSNFFSHFLSQIGDI